MTIVMGSFILKHSSEHCFIKIMHNVLCRQLEQINIYFILNQMPLKILVLAVKSFDICYLEEFIKMTSATAQEERL